MIDDNTLLQTNATVIAGILVLLTIFSFKYPKSETDTTQNRFVVRQKALATCIIVTIFLFSGSSITIILGGQLVEVGWLKPEDISKAQVSILGTNFSMFGFGIFVYWISVFVYTNPVFHTRQFKGGGA